LIHLHYDVKASKHLESLLTTDWQRERQALHYLYLILSYLFVLPTSFWRIHKTHNRTSLQVWHANVLHFCSFCKPTFSGATREGDAQCSICYNKTFWTWRLTTRHPLSAEVDINFAKDRKFIIIAVINRYEMNNI
jgi:hypothetical protein